VKRKAFGYLRVSGKGQARDGKDGLPRQQETIERYAQKHGIELVGVFQDVQTGKSDASDRAGLGALLTAKKGNGAQFVLVESMDRLARSVVVAEQTVMWLASHGLDVVNCTTGENVTEAYRSDPMRKAMIQMQTVFSELERGLIVVKLRKAREARRQATGRCEGPKFYGEKEGEVAAVRRVYELRRKRPGRRRLGSTRIAQVMQREGFPTRFGGEWTAQTVKAILASPVYREIGKRKRSEP